MRSLLVLLAVVLSLGACFSGGKPAPDPERAVCPVAGCGCRRYYGSQWRPGQRPAISWVMPGDPPGRRPGAEDAYPSDECH